MQNSELTKEISKRKTFDTGFLVANLSTVKKVKQKVVIIGGGFAGVETAMRLDKKHFEVHLFAEKNFFYLYPLFIWVPMGKKNISDVSLSLETLSDEHNFVFHNFKITHLDLKDKKIFCGSLAVSYDYLLIAGGSVKYYVHGSEDLAGIYSSLQDVNLLQQKYIRLLRQKQGHIAVGFGYNINGPSLAYSAAAFEILFNIDNDLRKRNLRKNFTLSFFTPMQEIAEHFGKKANVGILKSLRKKNVQIFAGSGIDAFNNQWVEFENGARIEADFTVYVAGNEGHGFYRTSQIPTSEAGFIKVSDYGQVEGTDCVFAAGDTVDFQGPAWMSKQVHLTLQQAKVIAANIKAHALKQKQIVFPNKQTRVFVVLDMGDATAFLYRSATKEMYFSVPLGYVFKWAWGMSFRLRRLGLFLNIFGL